MSVRNAGTVATSDAYCTTGSSPGVEVRRGAEVVVLDTSIRSPALTRPCSVHLVGAGAVGRAFLRLLDETSCIVTGITDSTGTVRGAGGIDASYVARAKERGRPVTELPGARALGLEDAIAWIGADIVVDATATTFTRPVWADALDRCVLARGGRLAVAAKDAVCARAPGWLRGSHAERVGCNAALGGTGRFLQRELPALADRCTAVSIAGNASTTTILEAVERGGTLDDGIAEAGRRGFLETDPELDLRGADAAVKLAIVAGALRGRPVDPASIPCDDIRTVDPAVVRERARRGHTTRLVARADEYGSLRAAYEEVERGSPLAVPCDRVVYLYQLEDGPRRVHIGAGLGAAATARALLDDVERLATTWRAPSAAEAVGGVR